MARIKRKTKSNVKLKPPKELPRCMVVLHDIALDKDLVQLYQLHLSVKKTEQVEHSSSSCTNTSKSSSNNMWMVKEKTLYKENTTENGTSHLTISLKRLAKEISKEECKNVGTSIKNQHTDNNTKRTTRQSLPKITGDHILPKGTIQIIKINTRDKNLQNNVSKQVPLEQNRCSSTDRSMMQVSHIDDTFESTDISREERYHTSEINKSFNMLKISRSTFARNNNINLKDKNIDNNKFDSGKINRQILNSLIEKGNSVSNNVSINNTDDERTELYENWFLKRQEYSDRLDNDEMYESNVLQNGKKEEPNRKQNRKRIAERDATDIKLTCKKKKLNRTSWLQNNATYARSINHQQFNDFLNTNTTVTVESNIPEENNSEEIIQRDLREHLNKKKTKQSLKLPMAESKFNDRNSAESKQLNLNNRNVITTTTNATENKEFCKRLSFEEETTFNKTLYEETDNTEVDLVCNNRLRYFSTPQSTSEETQDINQMDRSFHENTNVQDNNTSNMTEDDCISLFAESFDTNMCGNTFSNEKDKSCKSIHSDVPYVMTACSFDKYMKQNATEFNDEYEKCVKNNVALSNKTGTKTESNDQPRQKIHIDCVLSNKKTETKTESNDQPRQKIHIDCVLSNKKTETKTESNDQPRQKIHIDCVPATATASKLMGLPEVRNVEISKYPCLKKINIRTFVIGYCFSRLRRGTCFAQPSCRYKHDLQSLINAVCSENPKAIIDVIQDTLRLGYNFFCDAIYVTSLHKLTVDQILIIYQMLHDIPNLIDDFTQKRGITHIIIHEFFGRQMSLKTIVDCLVEHIAPIKNLNHLINILTCAERYIKPGEYWNTLRNLILRLPPDKYVIRKILFDCIRNEKLVDIQDINNSLINKLPPLVISTLDKDLMERFKSLLTEKTAKNSEPAVIVQNFGETTLETIASPDGTNVSGTESPKYDDTFINKNANKIKDRTSEENGGTYIIQPIDDLPNAQSAYRDHEHLWKFYVDLDRFKKGLLHKDYDYVINILKTYAEKQDESPLFVYSCSSILRTEVKRSEYHLANIIRRTVQVGAFDVLSKILFNIGLDILTSLVDTEAWGLALRLIQLLDIYDLPCNAEYFLLSAEIYLANKKAIKACDLLKNKNIIRTSRNKWYVKSTINDEHVRSKIIYILMDTFCSEFVEHAFYLFQFLLKDQSSQYYPIDLSRYVDKLIILFLLKNDTNLITEIGNLILKYNFALNTTTCRALISTLIHMDETLARQIYNYAEGIGIYSAAKLWPVTYIIINTDLTEEEIYLAFLQLLKNIIINFGHAIEFVKPHQIKVYLIFEIKSLNEQFYCAELQNYYNNKAITNIKVLVKNVLKKRFDPSILLMKGSKGRIYKLQSKSLINYLKTEHCN